MTKRARIPDQTNKMVHTHSFFESYAEIQREPKKVTFNDIMPAPLKLFHVVADIWIQPEIVDPWINYLKLYWTPIFQVVDPRTGVDNL